MPRRMKTVRLRSDGPGFPLRASDLVSAGDAPEDPDDVEGSVSRPTHRFSASDARIGLLAKHLQTTPDHVVNLFVTKDGSLDSLRRTLRDEKVMEMVLSKAEIEKGAK